MKIIFVITGIISLTTASAQQNDFFDPQKHLEKKNKSKFQPLIRKLSQTNPDFPKSSTTNNLSPQLGAKLSQTLPNGNKVYLLPTDNMPCIVPDMSHFNMPTTGTLLNYFVDKSPERKNFPSQIPNSITPWKIIPDSK